MNMNMGVKGKSEKEDGVAKKKKLKKKNTGDENIPRHEGKSQYKD